MSTITGLHQAGVTVRRLLETKVTLPKTKPYWAIITMNTMKIARAQDEGSHLYSKSPSFVD